MNFIGKVKEGIKGLNEGVPGGLPRFDKKIFNTQHGKIIGLIGSPKAGKTAMLLQRYIVEPYLSKANINWTFYSLEMTRTDICARLCSMFVDIHSKKERREALDHSPEKMQIPVDVIMGLNSERKLTQKELEYVEMINKVYIEPLMGVEDEQGNVITPGKIDFIEDITESNPTAIYKKLLKLAEDNGEIYYKKFVAEDDHGNKKTISYPYSYKRKNDIEQWVIVDHLGLMKKESGFITKANIDKFVNEYVLSLKKICKFTFILASQLNRGVKSVERMKFSGEELQPQSDDIKDSSALEESCDIIIAIFNPNMYPHLKAHMGYKLEDFKGGYRSVHVTTSRYTPLPVNTCVYFNEKTGRFTELFKKGSPELEKQLINIKSL